MTGNLDTPADVRHEAQTRHVWAAIEKFLGWLDAHGYASYDPYDLWGTPFGVRGRRLYYKKPVVGLPFVAPIILTEVIAPQLRQSFVRKERYATADGQIILAFLKCHSSTGQTSFLAKAERLAAEMLEYRVSGYSGHCWGYPFDWECCHRFYPKNTPFITSTPYAFEAFIRLHDVTGRTDHLETAKSIAQFVFNDLNDLATGPQSSAASYSTVEKSKVINASAYRAFVLTEAAHYAPSGEFEELAAKNVRFILESQREDGAWLYALDNPAEAFIDHFHTCFVLKNLFKLNLRRQDPAIADAIIRGYRYYRNNLFGDDGLPKSFAIQPRTQIVRLEMYNFAEAITLGCLLRNDIPEAFALARRLADMVCGELQLPDGHFVTRVYVGGWRHTFPYLRWPQAQLFLALTNILAALPRPASDEDSVSA